jgi:hypothetical protein
MLIAFFDVEGPVHHKFLLQGQNMIQKHSATPLRRSSSEMAS